MKNLLLAVVLGLVAVPLFAATETNSAPVDAEADYTKDIEKRTDAILGALALSDTNTTLKVHDAIIAQWRALRAWHDENDGRLKAAKDTNLVAQINGSLKTLHNQFIAKLSENLTPEQVVTVKDRMTYNVVHVTYNAYVKMYPDLTEAEKGQIMAWLVEARETSMDQGSANEKHAVFGKYKGRINNYLSKAGYDAKTGKKKTDPASGTSNTNQPAK